jgi:hypothetical protein
MQIELRSVFVSVQDLVLISFFSSCVICGDAVQASER